MAYNCTVRVIKFDNHNDKSKGKRMLWHRMDATIWGRHEFVATTPQTKLTWWWLLAQACTNPAREVTITARVMRDLGARTTRQLYDAIVTLETMGWIQVLTVLDPPAAIPLHTDKQTYKQTNEGSAPPVVEPPVQVAMNLPVEKTASPKANLIIAHYCDCFAARYGTNPPIGGKVAGQLQRFAKDYGHERAHQLITAYLSMPDTWYVTKRHDVATLLANLNAVAQFADTGKMVTKGHLEKINEKVEETLGPQPRGIADILADQHKAIPGGEKHGHDS